MFRSYITIALRTFWKDRSYTFINLIGLSIGFASILIIVAYVRFELSYDTTYSNAKNVYRCIGERQAGGTLNKFVQVPEPLSKALASEFPEIKSFTSLSKSGVDIVSKNNDPVTLQIINADANFFKVFNLPLLYGNPVSAMQTKGSVVISESTAKKLFPGKNPVGLTLTTEYATTHTIGGVMKDLPENIHFRADAVLQKEITDETLNWKAYRSATQYILLQPGANIYQLQKKLDAFYKKYGFSNDVTLAFQPVTSIHLYSNVPDEQFANSDIRYVYLFSAIALLILLIACVNYINLTTARSLSRVREAGVRKVMGAKRSQLTFQFLAESFLFFIITLPAAFIISKLLWPYFANLLHLQAQTISVFDIQTILVLFAISIAAGLLSGLYPAFFLSGLQPAIVLRGWRNIKIGLGLRKSLIVFQFVISIVLIIATIVVQLQLHFINNMQLGFNKEHLLILPRAKFKNNAEAFKQDLLANKHISNVSMAYFNVGQGYGATSSMENTEDSTKEWNFGFIDADFGFAKTLQIPIVQGRDFSPDYAADRISPFDSTSKLKKNNVKVSPDEWMNIVSSQSIIITKETAELIHLQKPYVGKNIRLGALQGTVIGIIEDFKGMSVRQKNPALVIRASANAAGNTFIRINPANITQTLSHIEKVWKKFIPNKSFQFSFADERIQSLYDSERRLASIFGIFAALGIGIACSGLFSLVALIVQQRTKEIGIRKVLGAGVSSIVKLLSADLIKLVIISIVVASPIAWLIMNKWLQEFAYRINISWWVFVIAGILAAIIAFVTISFQAIKAAVSNPVKSLRSE